MAVNFIKTGKAAQQHFERQEQESAKRDAEMKVNRFRLPNDTGGKVTFLDGKLNEDGIIDRAIWDEHRVPVPGRKMPRFFICTAEHEACPLCEQGMQRSTVNAFTVMDHRKWRDERRGGKVRQHERKLFLAKRDTMKRLQKLAAKRGGLRGWTLQINRTGDERSPSVGTDFEFLGKLDVEAFLAKTGLKKDELRPFKYPEVVVYYTADELRRMGFGSGAAIGEDDIGEMKRGKKKSQFNGDDDEDEDDDFVVKEPPKKVTIEDEDEPVTVDEDDDEGDVKAPVKTVPKKKAVKKAADSDWFEDEDEAPAAPKAVKKRLKKIEVTDDDEGGDDSPVEDDDIPF